MKVVDTFSSSRNGTMYPGRQRDSRRVVESNKAGQRKGEH